MEFLPMPEEISCGEANFTLANPCKLFFHIKTEEKGNEHISELISFQMKKSFQCSTPNYIISPQLDATLLGFDHIVEVQI